VYIFLYSYFVDQLHTISVYVVMLSYRGIHAFGTCTSALLVLSVAVDSVLPECLHCVIKSVVLKSSCLLIGVT